jgi:hypothetical protein
MNKSLVEGLANASTAILGIWRKTSQQLAEWFADLGYKVTLWMSGEKDYLTTAERTAARDSALNEYYDTLENTIKTNIDDLSTGIQESLDASLIDGENRIRDLKNELAGLRSDAALAADKARREREKAPDDKKVGGAAELAAKNMTATTFSSSALVSLGQGGGQLAKIHSTLREQILIQRNQIKAINHMPLTFAEKLAAIQALTS